MHYLVIPYFIIFLLYFVFILHKDDEIKRAGIVYFLLVAIFFFLVAMILQPLSGDTYRYSLKFDYLIGLSFAELINLSRPEFAYRLLNWLVGLVTSNFQVFIFTVFMLFITVFYKALKNIYPSFERYYIFLAVLLYPYVLSYIVSGKRQGIALVFMILAISFFMQNKKLKGTLSMLMIPFFHYGSLLIFPFIAIFVLFKEKNIFKIAMTIFLSSLLSSLSGLNQFLMDEIPKYITVGSQHIAYFESDGEFAAINYRVGFRLDFALFSIFPLILYFLFKNNINTNDKARVLNWLSVYLLLNSIYNFLSILPFNDRFSAFSWFILPIVCYEILRAVNRQYAILFSALLLFIGVILLQFYTSKYFLPLGLV